MLQVHRGVNSSTDRTFAFDTPTITLLGTWYIHSTMSVLSVKARCDPPRHYRGTRVHVPTDRRRLGHIVTPPPRPPDFFYYYLACSPPFVRLDEHFTALRAWCMGCLPLVGENSIFFVPAWYGFEGLWSCMRRRLCTK